MLLVVVTRGSGGSPEFKPPCFTRSTLVSPDDQDGPSFLCGAVPEPLVYSLVSATPCPRGAPTHRFTLFSWLQSFWFFQLPVNHRNPIAPGAEDAFHSAIPAGNAKAPTRSSRVRSPRRAPGSGGGSPARCAITKNGEQGEAAKDMKLTMVDFTDPAILEPPPTERSLV